MWILGNKLYFCSFFAAVNIATPGKSYILRHMRPGLFRGRRPAALYKRIACTEPSMQAIAGDKRRCCYATGAFFSIKRWYSSVVIWMASSMPISFKVCI